MHVFLSLDLTLLHGAATSSSNKHMLKPDLRFCPNKSILRPQLKNGYAYWCARTVQVLLPLKVDSCMFAKLRFRGFRIPSIVSI